MGAEHDTMLTQPRLLSIKQAAKEFGLSVWTVRDLIGSGKLRAVQPPGIRRIWLDRRDMERAIESWKS
jgi:excisionase family DNA binding protein